jgi:hypothetical protein
MMRQNVWTLVSKQQPVVIASLVGSDTDKTACVTGKCTSCNADEPLHFEDGS